MTTSSAGGSAPSAISDFGCRICKIDTARLNRIIVYFCIAGKEFGHGKESATRKGIPHAWDKHQKSDRRSSADPAGVEIGDVDCNRRG